MKAFVTVLLLAVCLARVSSQDAPLPPFTQQKYEILDAQNQICATFELAVKFLPEYMRSGNNVKSTQEVILPGVNDTIYGNVSIANSKCPLFGTTELVVEFGSQNMFTLTTMSNDSFPSVTANANWTVSQMQFQYNLADSRLFPNTADSGIMMVSISNPNIGTEGNQGGLYKCNAPSSFKLMAGNTTVDMELKDALLNPYNEPEDEHRYECSADASSGSSSDDKVVPIAVGCALGGLLLIVVIAFLIGRRSRRTGYKQV